MFTDSNVLLQARKKKLRNTVNQQWLGLDKEKRKKKKGLVLSLSTSGTDGHSLSHHTEEKILTSS